MEFCKSEGPVAWNIIIIHTDYAVLRAVKHDFLRNKNANATCTEHHVQ